MLSVTPLPKVASVEILEYVPSVPVGRPSAGHARGNQLPHKQLVSGLDDVSVQVADIGEIHDLIRAGATVACGGAHMQPRVEVVGLRDALAASINVIRPVAWKGSICPDFLKAFILPA